jgi:hypothetical protein
MPTKPYAKKFGPNSFLEIQVKLCFNQNMDIHFGSDGTLFNSVKLLCHIGTDLLREHDFHGIHDIESGAIEALEIFTKARLALFQ